LNFYIDKNAVEFAAPQYLNGSILYTMFVVYLAFLGEKQRIDSCFNAKNSEISGLNKVLDVIDPTCFYSLHNKLRGIGHAHFSENIFSVRIYGMKADILLKGDFLCC